MSRDYVLYLEDILSSVIKILKYAGDSSFEELIQDEMRVDAIVRNFEIIGEAAGHLPQEIKEKYPFVEWRKISDFRTVLAHEYFGIDYNIMWDVIKNKLPDLQNNIKTILEMGKSLSNKKMNPEDYILSVLSSKDRFDVAFKIAKEAFKKTTLGD